MARGLGINAVAAGAFEAAPGVIPGQGGYTRLPFVKHSLGEERGLLDSNLLGYGREPLDPTQDVANNRGAITVPVDYRAFGNWLRLMFGAATAAPAGAASGTLTFVAQAAVNSTVTLAGVAVTFVAGGAAGAQVNIGANVAATVAALQAYLAGLTSGPAFAATYTANGTVLTITHKSAGVGGNAFTVAASTAPASGATASAATLGGGTNAHTFTSGATVLPSLSLEIGNPDVPNYSTHYGCRADNMKIGMARSGLLDCDIDLIAQGETVGGPNSTAGALAQVAVTRFGQATGSVRQAGVELAGVVSADLMVSNSLDPVEVIKEDGRILDSDAGVFDAKGSFAAKFADRGLYDQARAGAPIALSMGWAAGNFKLVFNFPRVFLPVPKRVIDGPRGIQATYAWEASGALAASCTVVLTTDVASYA